MRKRASKPVDQPSGGDVSISTSLGRGLQILRAFRAGDGPLGNQDVADRTALPKATVSRIMLTLSELGYLIYDPALARYTLGPATIALGYSALSSSAVVHIARPLMQTLADETGAAVALGMRDELDMLYLANCRSESLVTLRLNPGSKVPLWKSAMGLAYLAGADAEHRQHLLARLAERDPASASAMDDTVAAAVAQFQSLGYCTSFGIWHSYINAVGVPFVPSDGSPEVVITCGGISEIITPKLVRDSLGKRLRSLVTELEATLKGERGPLTEISARD